MKSSPVPLKVHCTLPSSLLTSAAPLAVLDPLAAAEAPLPRPAARPWDAPPRPLPLPDLHGSRDTGLDDPSEDSVTMLDVTTQFGFKANK